MAGSSLLLRESGRSSKPQDPNTHSFLTLPAELRDRIYDLLFESKEPMRIVFSQTIKAEVVITHLRLETGVAVALFSTCRTILQEAGPVLYMRNTFVLRPIFGLRHFELWINNLGSHAKLLRHVTLEAYPAGDTDNLHPSNRVIDVQEVLEMIWNVDLTLQISFDVFTTFPRNTSWYRNHAVPAMTRNFRALQNDELNLRRYLPVLDSVLLYDDGSGGVIVWYTTSQHAIQDNLPGDWEPLHTSKIISGGDDANRLSIIETERPKTLMELPDYLLTKIWNYFIFPPEGITVDLDTKTHFKNEAMCTNRYFYRHCRSYFLEYNPVTVKMATSTAHSDFSDFAKLRQLLRKTFGGRCAESTLGLEAGFQVILDFKLGQLATLEDLRVSVLALVMESCHAPANSTVNIRLWQPDLAYATDQVVISLGQLRRKIVEVLKEFVKSGTHKAAPGIWINADGEVVEVVEKPPPDRANPLMPMPEMASRVVRVEYGLYKLFDVHPRDYRTWKGDSKVQQIGCVFDDCDQFFPYHHSALETLRHIATTLNESQDDVSRSDL